ncbi:SNF2-related protein, partial [Rhizobium ruizarguesonis]
NIHTAKTMNIDFVLGMTGTPIENRLEDLWCIMDLIAPVYLGDLKSFSSTYGDEDPQALAWIAGIATEYGMICLAGRS